ncbi:two-component system sensor protein [Duganella sp. FT80W]|uniref:histidine kinase n=1 Tax=Duganella guangzhouensis TaxID=2666084 RepID=A0A6I2KY08_9BURK|nr:ATP-binding protein [Duganella guangzhouensis]MRW88899.1 two-component system sensor protein [Duganella guangzhouensis]
MKDAVSSLHPRHWSLGVKVGMIVAASLVLLLGSAATSYTLERNTAAATAEMLRTMQTQADIQRLHTQIAEAATGVRGYLLTGRDDFLTPYRAAALQLPATLASLEDKVSDAEQRASLRRIRPLLESKLASLEVMRGQRNASAVELQQHLLSSKEILDQLRAEIAVMNTREAELVAQRTAALQGASNRNLWMTIAIVAAGLAGTLATLAFTIGLVRRVRLAVENAERLTSDQPLKPTPANTDELGQLAERLHQASVLLAGRATAAQAANQAKTAFLARTSHELRTPLNAILGYAQLLEAGLNAPRDREHAEHIRQAGQHLLSLIDEVLDIGRIEAGKLTLHCEAVALAPLVAEALTLMAPMAQQRGVQLRHAAIADSVAVMADRQRLLQVMLNLLSNAIKYGGGADIGCTLDGDVVSLHIDDDGPGIAPEMQARLFTPFDRLGAERGKAEGAGLGLTVSKALIQAMQGDLEYADKPTRGSRFTLTLAVADARAIASTPDQAEGQRAPAAATPETSAITHHLLCIDGDAATRILIATLMRRRPHWRLNSAEDRDDGLTQARAQRPDLLLVAAELADAELRATAPLTILLGSDVAGQLSKPLNVPAFFALLDHTEQTP